MIKLINYYDNVGYGIPTTRNKQVQLKWFRKRPRLILSINLFMLREFTIQHTNKIIPNHNIMEISKMQKLHSCLTRNYQNMLGI